DLSDLLDLPALPAPSALTGPASLSAPHARVVVLTVVTRRPQAGVGLLDVPARPQLDRAAPPGVHQALAAGRLDALPVVVAPVHPAVVLARPLAVTDHDRGGVRLRGVLGAQAELAVVADEEHAGRRRLHEVEPLVEPALAVEALDDRPRVLGLAAHVHALPRVRGPHLVDGGVVDPARVADRRIGGRGHAREQHDQ